VTTGAEKAELGWAQIKPTLEVFAYSEFDTYESDYIEIFDSIRDSSLGKRIWTEVFKHSEKILPCNKGTSDAENHGGVIVWLLQGIRNAKGLSEAMRTNEDLTQNISRITSSIKHLELALQEIQKSKTSILEPILFIREKCDLKILSESPSNGHHSDSKLSPTAAIDAIAKELTAQLRSLEAQSKMLKSVTSTGGKNAELIAFARDLAGYFLEGTNLKLAGTVTNILNIIFNLEGTSKTVERKWVESVIY